MNEYKYYTYVYILKLPDRNDLLCTEEQWLNFSKELDYN